MIEKAVRLLVAEDQAIVRQGLVMVIDLLPGLTVVGEASNGAQALRLAATEHPDIVLMDLRMPDMDGVEATRRIREELPGCEVLVLTTYADDESILDALRAGARGYLTKNAHAEEISAAVGAVMRGEAPFDPAVQRRLADLAAADRTPAAPDSLTPREVEVLRLIAEGMSNSEIARHMYITEGTVKTHINNLFAKAGVRDRAQAVTYAFHNGLATIPGDDRS